VALGVPAAVKHDENDTVRPTDLGAHAGGADRPGPEFQPEDRGTPAAELSPDPEAPALTAILVDHHPLWLDAVEKILDQLGISTIERLPNAADAPASVERLRPDLLVLDIEANGAEGAPSVGLASLRECCERLPGLRAIVFTNSNEPETVEAAFVAGAAAYVIKTAGHQDFASAIRQTFEQSIHFANAPAQDPVGRRPPADDPGLTRREVEILRLVANGLTNGEVAKALFVTEQTVKFHLSNIYRKLGVTNRTEASRWAQLQGILSDMLAGR
jgi:DNA-binding NarL/FixJ family response regulator